MAGPSSSNLTCLSEDDVISLARGPCVIWLSLWPRPILTVAEAVGCWSRRLRPQTANIDRNAPPFAPFAEGELLAGGIEFCRCWAWVEWEKCTKSSIRC